MIETPNIKEEIVDSVYYLDDVDEKLREDVLKDLYKTKEKTIAAFLKARGYIFRGIEKISITTSGNRRKQVIAFCFEGGNTTRRAILEFYNSDDPKYFTVNAKLILAELRNINSLIANF